MAVRAFVVVAAVTVMLDGSAIAQTAPPSGSPSSQGAQVPGGNQPKADQNQGATAGKVPILNSPQPPQDQEGRGNGAKREDRIGSVDHQSPSDERLINLTFWLVIATLALMAATTLLWWETRKLANQAKEASKDTKDSIEIARKSAAASMASAQAAIDALHAERAWLTIGEMAFEHTMDGRLFGVNEECIAFIARWVNTGKSPALFAVGSFSYQVVKIGDPIPTFEGPLMGDAGRYSGTIGAGTDMTLAPAPFFGEDFQKFKRGELDCYMHALVQYKTVYHGESLKQTESTWQLIVLDPGDEDGRGFKVGSMIIGSQNRPT